MTPYDTPKQKLKPIERRSSALIAEVTSINRTLYKDGIDDFPQIKALASCRANLLLSLIPSSPTSSVSFPEDPEVITSSKNCDKNLNLRSERTHFSDRNV